MSATFIIAMLAIFMLNIPFGYWRANVRRFSLQWYLAIHLPVPFIILLRLSLHIGWHWSSYAGFVLAFAAGQFAGSLFHRRLSARYHEHLSSCLFMALMRRKLGR